MFSNYKWIPGILAILFAIFFFWYFSSIIVYALIAGVLSFIGHPLVHLLDRIRLGKRRMPHALSATFTLLTMIVVFAFIIMIFVPVISKQANVISKIDFVKLENYISEPLQSFESFLADNEILPEGQTLDALVTNKIKKLVDMTTLQNFFGNIAGFAGSLVIGLFSVLFLTFFFLKDEKLFFNAILLFVPDQYDERASRILIRIRESLSRYFIGLSIELLSMMTLIFIGLFFFGVENALLIAFLGGLMNIIPYVGPIIGILIGIFITTVTGLSAETYEMIPQMTLIVLIVFGLANMIDNFLLQPFIYSNVVQAHPVEIFLVILIAGSLAGILGMIFAIPSYMLLRIILSELFDGYDITDKLVNNKFT
jgi:predicted PurR-regulated permease PerM